MTKTNKNKLVNWDADFYKSLSDEECLYCFTEKQIYVIGQALQQVMWSTRWFGDTSGLDFSAIAGEIEETLAMPRCEDLGEILNAVNDLTVSVAVLQATVENDGTPPPEALDTIDTPLYANTSTNLEAPIGNVQLPCATNDDKDKLYGGVDALTNFLIQNVTDFFEVVGQAVANPTEVLARIVSAIPAVGLLPFDEATEHAAWLVEEFYEGWTAMLTEDRIQDLKCKIFCWSVANDCKLTPELLMQLFTEQMPTSAVDFIALGVRDAIRLLTVGGFTGDNMFYSMLGIQVQIAAIGQRYLENEGWRPYEYRFLSGTLDPSEAWTVFCVDCPPLYWFDDIRFEFGDGGFVAAFGTYEDGLWKGEETDPDPDGVSHAHLDILLEIPEGIHTRSIGFDIADGNKDCGIDERQFAIQDDGTHVGGAGDSAGAGGALKVSMGQSVTLVGNELRIIISATRCDGTPAKVHLRGIRIWTLDTSPYKGNVTEIVAPGTTNTDGLYWINWGYAD